MAGARLFCFAMQRGREAPAENSCATAIAALARLPQSPSNEGRARARLWKASAAPPTTCPFRQTLGGQRYFIRSAGLS